MTASAIYRGVVRHRRRRDVEHRFAYRLYMAYLDLDEVEGLLARRWLWSWERPNLVSFRRRDFLGPPNVPLAEAVRDRVERELGRRPSGPVRMLTNLRCLGLSFNPVTFYYCFRPDGQSLDAVVAEITNTPWNERHAYVLAAEPQRRTQRHRFAKRFHVSPFLPMQQQYDWALTVPGERLVVSMRNLAGGRIDHRATLVLERRPFTARVLAGCLARHPFMTGKVLAGIYWQALRLRVRGARFHPHPRTLLAERSS